MAHRQDFSDEEMKVDEGLGYPRAYAKLCRDRSLSPYSHGPPFTFTPYPLHPQMASKERELDEMFPIIDFEAKPTTKPRIFLGLLWKQLNHLGNAGFDPAVFRVDPYGNVIYYHADSASPLAWEIDHWFPLSRGGLTVPSNLRILQWQVSKRKQHKLEILVPWWDLQLGVSINQFLSIFAASNSDFRHRGFSLLFKEGACEELNESQSVDSHNFPHPFADSKERLGLAPAAVVVTRKDSYAAGKTLDTTSRQPRPYTPPIVGAVRSNGIVLKEKENPDMVTNPYQAIVMARDSLKHRDEASKMKVEIQRLDDEINVLKRSNEEEKLSIQDLEMELIRHKRRAEKCRRVAETQSSYRAMLEKMIRDAMHQSVVYKEQVRLNQAASSALMARLEAQKAICNSAEKELHSKFRQKEDLEKQIRPEWEQARKRSRIDDDTLLEDCKALLLQPVSPEHKELRLFLEDEQKLAQAKFLLSNDGREKGEIEEHEGEHQFDEMNEPRMFNIRTPVLREPEVEEDEESRKERGKGNVEKWLHMLLGEREAQGGDELNAEETDIRATNEVIRKLNERHPQKEMKVIQLPEQKKKEEMAEGGRTRSASTPRISVSSARGYGGKGCEKRKSFSGKETAEKGKGLTRSESFRAFRPIMPSSPSVILGMRKGVDCIRKKPLVIDDDDDADQENIPTNRFFRPSIIGLAKKTTKA